MLVFSLLVIILLTLLQDMLIVTSNRVSDPGALGPVSDSGTGEAPVLKPWPPLQSGILSEQLRQTAVAVRADKEALLKLFHVEPKYKYVTQSAELAAAAGVAAASAAQMLWWSFSSQTSLFTILWGSPVALSKNFSFICFYFFLQR